MNYDFEFDLSTTNTDIHATQEEDTQSVSKELSETESVAKELKEDVNWDGFFQLVEDLGSQLNERQLRFLKARLIEMTIAFLSKNIKWFDEIGWDHKLRNIRISTKFQKNSITTPKGMWKKTGRTNYIKLTNTLGSSEGRTLPKTFDFLMIVDTDCVGLVAHKDINAESTGDGLKASIPYKNLEIVVKNNRKLTKSKDIDIKEKLDAMLKDIILKYK